MLQLGKDGVMARRSYAKGVIILKTSEKDTLYDLIEYFDINTDMTPYYIDLKKDKEDLDKAVDNLSLNDSDMYELNAAFEGRGCWQFNITLHDLGSNMASILEDTNNHKLIEDLKKSDYSMTFDFVDIELEGNVFYKSVIELSHTKNDPIDHLSYEENNLKFLRIEDDNLMMYDIDLNDLYKVNTIGKEM